jgi:hypothetical protein
MIKISQSIVKKFEVPDFCPKRLKADTIDRLYEKESSVTLKQGIYFESELLGAGAKGQVVTDLPRNILTKKAIKEGKTIGDKKAAHLRIDEQVVNALAAFEKWGIEMPPMHYRQVELEVPHPEFDDVMMSLTLDFVSSIKSEEYGDYPFAIIDVKLTGSVDNDYGDYCWGTPEKMDHLQAYVYMRFFKEAFKDKLPEDYMPPFFYLVFDHSPRMKKKIVPFFYSEKTDYEMMERIELTRTKYLREQEMNWEARPNMDQCEKCPLNLAGDCEQSISNIIKR